MIEEENDHEHGQENLKKGEENGKANQKDHFVKLLARFMRLGLE